MNRFFRIGVCILIFSSACLYILQADENITIGNTPPVVIKTIPVAGNDQVDPELKEISVTFSKEMMTNNMWSWIMISKESFPKSLGEIRFLNDKKTCTAKVTLEPGKTYAIWFNSKEYSNFRDINNNPAIPYLLVFRTKDK